MLDDRRSQVLKALVEEYIITGEPVSSQAVINRSGLDVSSATVRNDLSRLESYGFVFQPHTSAGRLPTHQGYRFYVDHLSPGTLRSRTRHQIDDFFRDMHQQISEMLRDTSTLVSELTDYPAVVVGPGASSDIIRDVRLIPLGGTTVLAIAIADNGRVHQEYVDVGIAVDSESLESAERLVAAAFLGRPLDAPEDERLKQSELPAVVKRVVSPVSDKLASSKASYREVYVGGTSRMAALWSDLTMVRHLLSMLDKEALLIELLGDDTGETNVRFGPDIGQEDDIAVVTATYETPQGSNGKVGVIAPMRMNYGRTIRVVEEVSEALEESLGGER